MKKANHPMIPQFNLGNPSVTRIDSMNQLDAPLLITMEYCSGTHPEKDRVCLTEVTPGNAFYICSDAGKLFNSSFFLHQHNYYEIMLVLEGSVIQIIEDKEYHYSAGSACLINRNILHTEKLIGETRLLFIGMSVQFITSIMDTCKTPLFHEEDNFLSTTLWRFFTNDIGNMHQKAYIDFFPFVTDQTIQKVLYYHAEDLFRLSLFPDFGTTIKIMASICSLFQLFCDSTQFHVSFMPLNAKADYLLFCRITHVLEEKNGQISRQELREIFHYTSDYLGRIIKKYTGKNLYDYSVDFRMKKVCEMITQTNESISHILETLGFTNRNHFYKIFRRKYGMTPNEYRKMNKI